MWYKDDPQSQEKIVYYLSRLKAKEILQDPGGSLILSRESARKICQALGQRNSFSRGFDKILTLLLVWPSFTFILDPVKPQDMHRSKMEYDGFCCQKDFTFH